MTDKRQDLRDQDPDVFHKRAFMTGWTDAVNGKLYASTRDRKTHSNMGNLFGWVFGAKNENFRNQIWFLYLENALGDIEEE